MIVLNAIYILDINQFYLFNCPNCPKTLNNETPFKLHSISNALKTAL